MKKLLLFILSFMSVSAYAQFEIGLNAGAAFNHTHKSNEAFYEFGNYTSFYPEINAGYHISDHWSVNWGIGFTSRGYKAIPAEALKEAGETTDYCKFRYFTIPLYFSYRYPVNSFYGKLSLGLQPGFYVNQDTPARYEQDYQDMNHTIGILAGAEAGYFLNSYLNLHLIYRYTTDFNYADDYKLQGKLGSHSLLIGISYILNPVTHIETTYE